MAHHGAWHLLASLIIASTRFISLYNLTTNSFSNKCMRMAVKVADTVKVVKVEAIGRVEKVESHLKKWPTDLTREPVNGDLDRGPAEQTAYRSSGANPRLVPIILNLLCQRGVTDRPIVDQDTVESPQMTNRVRETSAAFTRTKNVPAILFCLAILFC
jgi:hypothetical protein